jgi:hypothetical protein
MLKYISCGIRKFLERERQRLLEEFAAPDISTLFWRAVFWTIAFAIMTAAGLGLAAIYTLWGMEAFWAAVIIVTLFGLWMEGRRPMYLGEDDGLWLGDQQTLPPPDKPALPPPGARALPPPSRRQIGRASSVLTRQQRRWP